MIEVSIIYLLVGLSILNFINVDNTQATKEIKENKKEIAIAETKQEIIKQEELKELEEVEKIEQETEEKNICKLSEIECKLYNEAIKQGLNNEQAYIILAISKHETGYWRSNLFINNNNLGGIYNSSAKKFYSYETQEKGITAMVALLKNGYFNKGLDTIEKIGAKYCPVGAKNDPKGLNKNWVPNVTKYYTEYLGK